MVEREKYQWYPVSMIHSYLEMAEISSLLHRIKQHILIGIRVCQ